MNLKMRTETWVEIREILSQEQIPNVTAIQLQENSSAELNRLSSELNSRISREMDEMMNSVSVQIQRAISDAISTQVLPQIQNVIMAGLGHGAWKGWTIPSERPELISEVRQNLNAKTTWEMNKMRIS